MIKRLWIICQTSRWRGENNKNTINFCIQAGHECPGLDSVYYGFPATSHWVSDMGTDYNSV